MAEQPAESPAAPPRWFERHAILAAIAVALVAAWGVYGWHFQTDPERSPQGKWAAMVAAETARAAPLRAREAALKAQLAGDVCTLDRPQGQPAAALPVPERIRRAAVMLMAFEPPNPGPRRQLLEVGTGFFIGPDAILTDAKAVGDAAGNEIVAVSPFLNRTFLVQPAAPSAPAREDQMLRVLRIEPPADPTLALPLAAKSDAGSYTMPIFVSPTAVLQRPLAELRRGTTTAKMPEVQWTTLSLHPDSLPALMTASPPPMPVHRGAPLVDACGRIGGVVMQRRDRDAIAVLRAETVHRLLELSRVAHRTDAESCRPRPPG